MLIVPNMGTSQKFELLLGKLSNAEKEKIKKMFQEHDFIRF